MHKFFTISLFSITLFIFSPVRLIAQEDSALQQLSLRELLNVKITTAGKISQSSELASAVVTVISREHFTF